MKYKNNEEKFFAYWLQELKDRGYIEYFSYESATYELTPKVTYTIEKQLKTKTKVVEKTLYQPMTYTPDFVIKFTPKALSIVGKPHQGRLFQTMNEDLIVYVDIKGVFAGKTNSTKYTFPLKQKFMYHIHRIIVQKVVTFEFMEKTFVPVDALLEHTYKKDCKHGKKGQSKFKYKIRTIEEWLSSL